MIIEKSVSPTGKTASLPVEFDLSTQVPGTYFVKVVGTEGIQTAKVFIKR